MGNLLISSSFDNDFLDDWFKRNIRISGVIFGDSLVMLLDGVSSWGIRI